MKKISFMNMAAAALLLSACTNAEPFDGFTDNTGDGQYVVPAGEGTEENPFNVSAALIHDMDGSMVWVEGYIVGQVAGASVNEEAQFEAPFTGAVYDDGGVAKSGTNLLVAASEDVNATSACLVVQLPAGDLRDKLNLVQNQENDGKKVMLYGSLQKYFGVAGMKETSAAKLDGQDIGTIPGGGTTPDNPGDAKGSGTQEDPYNVAAAVAQNNSGANAWVKGFIVGQIAGSSLDQSEFDAPFHGATYDDGTIATAGTNLLLADAADVASASGCIIIQLPAGDLRTTLELVGHPENDGKELVIYGQLTKYFTAKGLKSCSAAIFEGATLGTIPGGGGGGGTTPDTPEYAVGDGSKSNPYNIAAAVAQNNSGATAWIKAYIVGQVAGQAINSQSEFDAPFSLPSADATQGTNVLIAATATTTSPDACMPVQLPKGALRDALNLVDHPENDGKEVLLYGSLEKYFGVQGLKSITCAIIDGNVIGTDPGDGGGGTTPDTPPTGSTLFEETFNASLGAFEQYNKVMPSDISYVWSYDNRYTCAKASAYVSGTRYETESWLISPAIAMNDKEATLVFDHAANFVGAAKEEMTLFYSTNYNGDAAAATWTELTIPSYATSWTFISSGNIALPAAQTIHIAFVYKSTTSNACTWEIKNVKVIQ